MAERREPVREREREQEAEEHLDAEASDPEFLQQLGQVAVVALGSGLVAPGRGLVAPGPGLVAPGPGLVAAAAAGGRSVGGSPASPPVSRAGIARHPLSEVPCQDRAGPGRE